ncbi:MAG TPA: 3-phosphoserine/phosphohydroxythreonine transaminase [Wenzhouxiangella sp.]|nr:3-phosphoserine/phosphohydroxythreonine transaminase [Wenzhouxiangella sp.]
MNHVTHNFSAGPARLPPAVLERLSAALAPQEQPSIVEASHRGQRFMAVAEELHERVRRCAGIDEEHAVLLLHGGASLQFVQLPLNLAANRPAAFLITGHWGKKALEAARTIGKAVVAGSSEADGFTRLAEVEQIPHNCAYLHYTGNESIHGVQFDRPPQADVPLVADMSSEFLSRPYPYSDVDVAYAGAQKNLGIAGLTVVLMRRDLLERIPDELSPYLDYRSWADNLSLFNTPAVLAWVAALEMLRWMEDQGGLEAIGERNQKRAARLYAAIDATGFWHNPVAAQCRSVMNIPFWPTDERLTARFLAEAEQNGLIGLKGHRSAGGLRASLYNAQTCDAVNTLIAFMQHFEERYG